MIYLAFASLFGLFPLALLAVEYVNNGIDFARNCNQVILGILSSSLIGIPHGVMSYMLFEQSDYLNGFLALVVFALMVMSVLVVLGARKA